jgi:DNA-binding response OmpR family regulator
MERPLVAVVNSDQAFLDMMQEFLEDEGYEAVTLLQNHRAFEQIKARKPQLVVIELMLTDPESGWMILNKMRLDPQTTTIPVIIASTATDLIERNEENLRAKRCDILLKPFDLEELLAMVGKYVRAS